MTVPYPPAVWYLPKHVRDALINNTGQARSEPEGGEPPIGECEEHEQPLGPGQLFLDGPADSYAGRRLVDPDRSVLEVYHEQAVNGGSNKLCCNPACMHLAAANGFPCPVCEDDGWKPVTGDAGDAA
jgi:hypothetical protein